MKIKNRILFQICNPLHNSKQISKLLTETLFGAHITYCASSKFWGCQGRRTGVTVTAVSNLLILGGWVTKVLKNGDKIRGLKEWVTTIFYFFVLLYSIKMSLSCLLLNAFACSFKVDGESCYCAFLLRIKII